MPLGQKEGKVSAPTRCYLLLGVDYIYMDYTFAGNAAPKRSEYDEVCRFCARDGVRDGEDSSATVSSSSSSAGFWLNPPSLLRVSHLWPQPRCGQDRVRRTASGSPCRSASDRGRSTPRVSSPATARRACSITSVFLGVSPLVSGLAFPVPRCVRVCACVVFVPGPWWSLSCFCGCLCCVGCAALVGPGAGVGPVGAFRGSAFWSGVASWCFSWVRVYLAIHTAGV